MASATGAPLGADWSCPALLLQLLLGAPALPPPLPGSFQAHASSAGFSRPISKSLLIDDHNGHTSQLSLTECFGSLTASLCSLLPETFSVSGLLSTSGPYPDPLAPPTHTHTHSPQHPSGPRTVLFCPSGLQPGLCPSMLESWTSDLVFWTSVHLFPTCLLLIVPISPSPDPHIPHFLPRLPLFSFS